MTNTYEQLNIYYGQLQEAIERYEYLSLLDDKAQIRAFFPDCEPNTIPTDNGTYNARHLYLGFDSNPL